MSIQTVTPLPIGNAVRIGWEVPDGALKTRLLRKTAATFTGPTDGTVVYEGPLSSAVDTGVLNGTTYWYAAYFWDGVVWEGSTPADAIPAATYVDDSLDALSVVRDRLAAGLKVEVSRGDLRHETGAVPVLTAPPVFQDTRWPVVTVHMQSETDGERFLGETFAVDVHNAPVWDEREGWLARVTLQVIGWSLNPDERIALRKAIRRVIVGNLSVFDASGMDQIGVQMSDAEDFESYGAPVYQAMCTITCLAPVSVGGSVAQIEDVELEITPTTPQLETEPVYG